MTKQLTRRELFDLVWARPMTKIAADFGISDVALHKICTKHRIPVPGRGYWAKIAAGQTIKPALFREVPDAFLNNIFIQGSALQKLPPEVLEARERAKAASKDRAATEPLNSTAPTEINPLLLPLQQKLERTKVGENGFIHASGKTLFSVLIAPASTPRTLMILNALITAALVQGHTVGSSDTGLHLSVNGETISLSITEKTDRLIHQVTEAEARAMQKWEVEQERKRLRGTYYGDWDKPRIPEWDFAPNGLLVIEIDQDSRWDGLRRKFSDGRRQRLENMIDKILTAAVTCAAAEKSRREKAERQKLEWEEEKRLREEEERISTLETKRREFLDHQIKILERAQRIDNFANNYASIYAPEELTPGCRQLIDWARRYADLLRGEIAPEQLTTVIDEHQLMDDSTDIGSWVEFE